MADGSLDGASAFPLPEGAWIDGADVRGDLAASFDVVVVGSGAAGAVAAQRLARAGLRVAIVEEGPWLAVPALGGDVIDGFGAIFRDAGMQAIEGRSFIPLLQGRCVGGSTVVNSAIAWRVPEEIVADWRDRFGVAFTVDELAREYDSLEAELGCARSPTPCSGRTTRASSRPRRPRASRRSGCGATIEVAKAPVDA